MSETNNKYEKLELLISIVDRGNGDTYKEMYEKYSATWQITMLGSGTANSEMLDYLGLTGTEKDVVLTIVKETQLESIFTVLNTELKEHGTGIAFSVPLNCLMGKAVYNFVTDNQKVLEGEQNG